MLYIFCIVGEFSVQSVYAIVQKAGFDKDRIVECHGSIHFLQHVDTSISSEIWPMPRNTTFDVDSDLILKSAIPDGPARPNILMFGDWDWQGDRTRAQEKRYRAFQQNSLWTGIPFVVIEIGAGTDFSDLITSTKEAVFLPEFVCLFVCLSVC